MKPHDLTVALLAGAFLIALGLVPGLFRGLVLGLAEGIQNFRDSISSGVPVRVPRCADYGEHQRPIWLAAIGAALVLLSLLAYAYR